MYNVRNTSGRILAIRLEKGGVAMRPNSHLDLDTCCSRKWIDSNADLRKLRIQGYILLVHDSYAPPLPKAPTKNIQRPIKVSALPKKDIAQQPVQIVDLEATPDVEVDDDKQIVLPEVPEVSEVLDVPAPQAAAQPEVKLIEVNATHPMSLSLADLVGPEDVVKIEASEEKVEAVLPVPPDPEPKEVAADPFEATRDTAPVQSESKPELDLSAGFDASRLPRMKRRRFDQKGKR